MVKILDIELNEVLEKVLRDSPLFKFVETL